MKKSAPLVGTLAINQTVVAWVNTHPGVWRQNLGAGVDEETRGGGSRCRGWGGVELGNLLRFFNRGHIRFALDLLVRKE